MAGSSPYTLNLRSFLYTYSTADVIPMKDSPAYNAIQQTQSVTLHIIIVIFE